MSSLETNDESFIILGTSPGTSLDLKCNGIENGVPVLDKLQLDDALKDLSAEASMAFKAHFKLEDGPSPASVMVASSIITDNKTTEELQHSFGQLLDENVILKETLKQNNESMKEQFLLIASCQEDMMKTHTIHKEKFDETRVLVEKLRQENKKLKVDMARLVEGNPQPSLAGGDVTDSTSGPSSALEFVTSPDDDTIDKLTAQLELVEKQRRQVIVDNDKLTWQKESLEHIVDAITKERDDVKEKLKISEMKLSNIETEYTSKITSLNITIQELQTKLQKKSVPSISPEELTSLEAKLRSLTSDLKNAQLKILELETYKLEYTKVKSGVAETMKIHKNQITELQNRLKEAQTTVFQPVRLSVSEDESPSGERAGFISNVNLYDKTLKHLADLLNLVANGASDSLVQTLGVVSSLHDYKLDRTTVDQFKAGLAEVKLQLSKQHTTALSNISHIKGMLSIFEGIFKDYNEMHQKSLSTREQPPSAPNIESLTAALVARGQDIQALEAKLHTLRDHKEDNELLKVQVEQYKSDFEAERDSRAKMASEKDSLMTDLRTAQRRNQELVSQLEEVRKLNPNIFKSATTKRQPTPPSPAGASSNSATGTTRRASGPVSGNNTTGNVVYSCPKCLRFSSKDYGALENHFDFCLDDF